MESGIEKRKNDRDIEGEAKKGSNVIRNPLTTDTVTRHKGNKLWWLPKQRHPLQRKFIWVWQSISSTRTTARAKTTTSSHSHRQLQRCTFQALALARPTISDPERPIQGRIIAIRRGCESRNRTLPWPWLRPQTQTRCGSTTRRRRP